MREPNMMRAEIVHELLIALHIHPILAPQRRLPHLRRRITDPEAPAHLRRQVRARVEAQVQVHPLFVGQHTSLRDAAALGPALQLPRLVEVLAGAAGRRVLCEEYVFGVQVGEAGLVLRGRVESRDDDRGRDTGREVGIGESAVGYRLRVPVEAAAVGFEDRTRGRGAWSFVVSEQGGGL